MCDQPVFLNLHDMNGSSNDVMNVRPQANSLWAEEDKCYDEGTHLAEARGQKAGPAFWDDAYEKKRLLASFLYRLFY